MHGGVRPLSQSEALMPTWAFAFWMRTFTPPHLSWKALSLVDASEATSAPVKRCAFGTAAVPVRVTAQTWLSWRMGTWFEGSGAMQLNVVGNDAVTPAISRTSPGLTSSGKE